MKIKAQTLSVILPDSKSVFCYIEVGGESCNVSLRFDRAKAEICGYPQAWAVYDTPIEAYNCESPNWEELEFLGELDVSDSRQPPVYVSREIEATILEKLKASVAKQFKSKDWKDTCPKSRQTAILKLIDKALKVI